MIAPNGYCRTEVHLTDPGEVGSYRELLVFMLGRLRAFDAGGPPLPSIRCEADLETVDAARAFAEWLSTDPDVRIGLALGRLTSALAGDPQEVEFEIRGSRVALILSDASESPRAVAS